MIALSYSYQSAQRVEFVWHVKLLRVDPNEIPIHVSPLSIPTYPNYGSTSTAAVLGIEVT